MSKLDTLLNELCPNGVEFKELWEVTAWDKKFNAVDNHKQKKVIKYHYLLANDLKQLQVDGGDVKLLTTNNSELYTTSELAGDRVSDGEVVTIPWGGTANVQYYKGKFLTADNRLATSLDTSILDNKYLYYFMLNNTELIQSFYRGSGIQHPSMAKVLDMKIPLPPLPVQAEIVRILDKFTALEAELEAELEARTRQYEYYRNQLLDSSVSSVSGQWLEKTLGEVCNFMNGKGHEQDIDVNGKYIVVNSKFVSTEGAVKKYSNKQICPVKINDILIVMSDLPNGRALAKTFFVEENDKYTLNQRIGGLTVKDPQKLMPKFLNYFISRTPQLLKYDSGADQTNLKKEQILNVKIPIPPLAEQERIVAILDKFDALTHDIKEGLPAEIKARRQQYEYYRNKLLSFRE